MGEMKSQTSSLPSGAWLPISCSRAGVAIKVVTGDSERVTRHVAHALGLPVQRVITGAEIALLNDEALRAQVETVNLFCRVNPTQKNRVIQAVQARGHVVGCMGDGVNDAPSLHSADVGLSVDAAVDVAKAAADMVLLQPDLRILQDAVTEGRRTFGNILKYILMGTSSNFGNMFSMAGAVLLKVFDAQEALFQTDWFLESLCTQVLAYLALVEFFKRRVLAP